jgi:hypothetical protein
MGGMIKKYIVARHQWHTPVILATQEAEIRRIAVQSQPWSNSSQDPILKKTHHNQKGWWSDSRCRPWVQTPVRQKEKERKKYTAFMYEDGTRCWKMGRGKSATEGENLITVNICMCETPQCNTFAQLINPVKMHIEKMLGQLLNHEGKQRVIHSYRAAHLWCSIVRVCQMHFQLQLTMGLLGIDPNII